MERLTERDEFGNADITGVDSESLQLSLSFEEFNKVTEALNKLAEYEDLEGKGEMLRRKAEYIYAKGLFPEEYEKMFEAIESALGFELFVWQKYYIVHGSFRQYGATTAEVLRDLMMVNKLPLDFSSYSGNQRQEHYRQTVREIKQQLDEAGVPTREVFFNREQKEAYMCTVKQEKNGEKNYG